MDQNEGLQPTDELESVIDDLEPEIPEPEEEIVEPEDELDDEPELDAQPEKNVGRLARVTRERKEANERARLAEEKTKLLELQMQNLQRQSYQPKVEDEHLDPDEKWRRQANEAIQRTQFQTFDAIDKNTYDVKALNNPVYKRWASKVESELAKARQQGANPSRENILKFLIGEATLGKIKAPSAKAKTPARQAAERVTVPGGRSTVSPSKKEPSLRDKLTGVKL